MKKLIYILISLTLMFSIGCRKIDPPLDESEANEPIYKIQGLMNGDSLNLYVDDSTVFISNDPYNFNGVEAYSSTISDVENDFMIRMIVLRPERFIDEAGVKLIENKDVDYIIDQEVCLGTSFGNSNQNNYYHIKIDGQQFSGGNFGVHGYGNYSAIAQFPNINTQEYEIQIPVGFNNSELKSKIHLDDVNSNVIYFAADTNLFSTTHKWYIDEVFVGTQASFNDTIGYGLHTVTHEVKDEFGNTAEDKSMFYMNNNVLEWQINIQENICGNPDYVANNYGRGFVEIERKGELFTTLYNPNNTAYKLKVTNIQYISDPLTQSIKMIKFNLNFDAELKNADETETILLQDMQGVFQIQID